MASPAGQRGWSRTSDPDESYFYVFETLYCDDSLPWLGLLVATLRAGAQEPAGPGPQTCGGEDGGGLLIPSPSGPPAPLPTATIAAAIDRGVNFLLGDQRPDGSWGSPEHTKDLNIIAGIGSHHAFRVATTALCVSALIELTPRQRQRRISRGRTRFAGPSSGARNSCSASFPGFAAMIPC